MSTFHDIGVKDQSSQAEKTFIKERNCLQYTIAA